jgi:hypothetical protein
MVSLNKNAIYMYDKCDIICAIIYIYDIIM